MRGNPDRVEPVAHVRVLVLVLVHMVLVALVLVGCGDAGPELAAPVEVVRVESMGCDRPQPRVGVGSVVADGVVLTAAHIVDGDLRDLRVDGVSAAVVGIDIESDLALLALDGPLDAAPSWRVAFDADAVPGPVDILTGGGVIETDLVRTLVLRVDDISAGITTERAALELAVVVDEGHSGSPVVDADGAMLGVVVLRRQSTGVSYASRVPTLAHLLDTGLYQEVLDRSDTNADGRPFARSGRCT